MNSHGNEIHHLFKLQAQLKWKRQIDPAVKSTITLSLTFICYMIKKKKKALGIILYICIFLTVISVSILAQAENPVVTRETWALSCQRYWS